MTTALALQDENGKPIQEYRTVTDELIALIPGDPDAPVSVKQAAAHLAVAHGLDPFNGEIYVFSTGSYKDKDGVWRKKWSAEVGIKGYRRSARDQGDYEVWYERMSDEEVKKEIGVNYTESDIGVRCIGYRLDKVKRMRELGLEVKPKVALGFWRLKAQKKGDRWIADNIPATWTRAMVAEKRSEKNFIKLNFDLGFNDVTVKIEEPVAETIVMDADAALLYDRYGKDGLLLKGDQRELAIEQIKHWKEAEAEYAELEPEQRQEKAAKNIEDMGRGSERKKRLGDDDRDPLPPKSYTPDELLKAMKKERGGSVLEEMGYTPEEAEAQEDVEDGEFVEAKPPAKKRRRATEKPQGKPEQPSLGLDTESADKAVEEDWVANALIAFPGIFKTRKEGDLILTAILASFDDPEQARESWQSVISKRVDDMSAKEN